MCARAPSPRSTSRKSATWHLDPLTPVKSIVDWPRSNDEYNPWNNPAPSRAFILATGFANQRGNAVMLLEANSRRRSQRANHRHASG